VAEAVLVALEMLLAEMGLALEARQLLHLWVAQNLFFLVGVAGTTGLLLQPYTQVPLGGAVVFGLAH
jgi:hypothetical protein